MKKNEAMGYVVYILMLAVAIGIGLGAVRPILASATNAPMNQILFIVLTVLSGLILNSLFIELGHLIGAKIGKYKIISWCWLGFCFKRGDQNKFKFCFSGFDGLTGETIVTPLDKDKSNLKHFVYFPLLFLLVEVILGVVGIVLITIQANNSLAYWKAFIIVILALAAMLYLYDFFPAGLDNKNDGYLLTILTNATNRKAYNELLIAEDKNRRGEKVDEILVYDKVTNFTAKLNNIALYKKLDEKDIDGALNILEKTIECKNDVSDHVFCEAVSQKIALLIAYKFNDEVKEFYIAQSYDVKKYIANLSSCSAVRAYILVSSFIEESITETKIALNKIDNVLSKEEKTNRQIDEKLFIDVINLLLEKHPDWDFSEFSFSFTKKEDTKDKNKDKKE